MTETRTEPTTSGPATGRPKVLVVGAGFGGLALARSLADTPADVIVLDRTNHHLFQPLLYQVATAQLAPTDIAYPVRGALRRVPNASFRAATVTDLDWQAREIATADGARFAFDHLVLAAGARTASFGVDLAHAETLKTVDDALALRQRLLTAFERAQAEPELVEAGALDVVVVGGGPTGVELAGAVSELYRNVLARDFPDLPVHRAQISLVELDDGPLAGFHPQLRAYTAAQLRRRGVQLHFGRRVTEAGPDRVTLDDGLRLRVGTTVWAAGVEAQPLATALGLPTGGGGRVAVDADLSVPGYPGVWAIGDVAAARDGDGALLPQLAPVAQQAGRHVASQIARAVHGEPTEAFAYRDKGAMATIGRRAAVAQAFGGRVRLRGTLGWLAWLWLHLAMLIGFRNRASVLLDWAWTYLGCERGGRLLVRRDADPAGDQHPDPVAEKAQKAASG
ncbi:MAG: NAD(P)/FAD-dependent oxidoreductase [Actinobacteria bacterium QS_8_72_14]|nr:MAG: NAD(P)/FAD-dependent oxidoreductase [Actinobacteria bacterium QS_8_72_14]